MPDNLDRGAAPGADIALLIARILLAAIFVQGGFGKLTGLEGFAGYLTGHGVPANAAYPLSIVAAIVEFFGGLAILLGFMARYVALLMALFVLVAAFIGHRYWEITDPAMNYNQTIHFMKNVAIIGGFLALYAAGPGRFSVDRRGT